MKPKAMLIFLFLLAIGILIGVACGIAEEHFWNKNMPELSVSTDISNMR